MNSIHTRPAAWSRRLRLTTLAMAAGAAVGSAWAQTALPATPPVSPTQVIDFEYDAEGQPTKTIVDKVTTSNSSGLGLTSSQHYNPLGQLDQSADPKNGVTKLEYDGQGRLTKVTDPLNLITEYLRNGLGDLSQQSSPDTGYSGFSKFDAAGNPVLRNDARSSTGVATYDAKNRLTRMDYTLIRLAETYTWTYDQTGPAYGAGIGHLTSTSTSIGVGTTYQYDNKGRLVGQTQTVPSQISGVATNLVQAGRLHHPTAPKCGRSGSPNTPSKRT